MRTSRWMRIAPRRASSQVLTAVAARIRAPPASDQAPGRSPCASQAQTGLSTGSSRSRSEASKAGTRAMRAGEEDVGEPDLHDAEEGDAGPVGRRRSRQRQRQRQAGREGGDALPAAPRPPPRRCRPPAEPRSPITVSAQVRPAAAARTLPSSGSGAVAEAVSRPRKKSASPTASAAISPRSRAAHALAQQPGREEQDVERRRGLQEDGARRGRELVGLDEEDERRGGEPTATRERARRETARRWLSGIRTSRARAAMPERKQATCQPPEVDRLDDRARRSRRAPPPRARRAAPRRRRARSGRVHGGGDYRARRRSGGCSSIPRPFWSPAVVPAR